MFQIVRRVFLPLLLVSLLFSPGGKSIALAQGENEPTGLKNVHLFLFPEYDDPRLLVMIEGQIEGAEAPVKVRFLVPQAAEMYSAGSLDANRVYKGGPPERQSSEVPGWDEISYELTTDIFRVEYYDPIILGGPTKSISYDFRTLYPISNLEVIVQQPRTALDLKLTPASTRGYLDDEGLNSYQYTFNDLDIESPLHFDVTYYKTDDTLSIETNNGPVTGTIMAVIGGAILALGAGVFVWLRMRSAPKTRAERRRTGVTRAARAPRSVKNAGERYCTQCGQSISGSYKFCPDCGAKVS